MNNKPQRSSKTLWLLAGIVGGLIGLGWLISFPIRHLDTSLGVDLSGLKEAWNTPDQGIGGLGDFEDIVAEATATQAEEPEGVEPEIILTEDQIHYIEERVFDDPAE